MASFRRRLALGLWRCEIVKEPCPKILQHQSGLSGEKPSLTSGGPAAPHRDTANASNHRNALNLHHLYSTQTGVTIRSKLAKPPTTQNNS